MPELPEVETVIRDLKKKILGLTIQDIWYDWKKLFKLPKDPEQARRIIIGKKIIDLRRRAKNILIDLGGDYLLLIHQKMTGHMLVGKWKIENNKAVSLKGGPLQEKVNDYVHLIFRLSNGSDLALSDLRKFAKLMVGRRAEIEGLKELRELGPEPLEKSFAFEKFKALIKKEKRKIKQVLMDQTVISGIGNIYSDEILWKARVFPLKPVGDLSFDELKKIYLATREILEEAVRLRGTSISDFRDPSGREGGYAPIRRVYRREGEKCPRCKTSIKRMKIGGRSAHYCPACQRP